MKELRRYVRHCVIMVDLVAVHEVVVGIYHCFERRKILIICLASIIILLMLWFMLLIYHHIGSQVIKAF